MPRRWFSDSFLTYFYLFCCKIYETCSLFFFPWKKSLLRRTKGSSFRYFRQDCLLMGSKELHLWLLMDISATSGKRQAFCAYSLSLRHLTCIFWLGFSSGIWNYAECFLVFFFRSPINTVWMTLLRGAIFYKWQYAQYSASSFFFMQSVWYNLKQCLHRKELASLITIYFLLMQTHEGLYSKF